MMSPLIRLPIRPNGWPQAAKSAPASSTTSGLSRSLMARQNSTGTIRKMAPKEGHATFPGGQDMLGLEQVILHQVWLLDHEIEASAHKPGHHTPPEHTVDLLFCDALP